MPIIFVGTNDELVDCGLEIPFAFNLTPTEYKKILQNTENISEEFDRECIRQAKVEDVRGKTLIQTNESKEDALSEDPKKIRSFVVENLIRDVDSPDWRNRIKALELLGKGAGLFIERKEVVHKDYKEEEVDRLLEQKIKELMHEKTIEAQVLTLEEEAQDAEFTEEFREDSYK
jgi:hypothetical protein